MAECRAARQIYHYVLKSVQRFLSNSWARQILPFTSAATLDRGVLDRPYLLPCIVVAAIGLTILILDIFFMEETQPDIRRRHAKRNRAKAIRATGSQTSESAALLSPGAALQLKTNIGHNVHGCSRLINPCLSIDRIQRVSTKESPLKTQGCSKEPKRQAAPAYDRASLSCHLHWAVKGSCAPCCATCLKNLMSRQELRDLVGHPQLKMRESQRTHQMVGRGDGMARKAHSTRMAWEGGQVPQHWTGRMNGPRWRSLHGQEGYGHLGGCSRSTALYWSAMSALTSAHPLLQRLMLLLHKAWQSILLVTSTPCSAEFWCHRFRQPGMFWPNCGSIFSWRGQVVLKSHSLF